jgi:hypothetical protein
MKLHIEVWAHTSQFTYCIHKYIGMPFLDLPVGSGRHESSPSNLVAKLKNRPFLKLPTLHSFSMAGFDLTTHSLQLLLRGRRQYHYRSPPGQTEAGS